jgi:hypothetical protein
MVGGTYQSYVYCRDRVGNLVEDVSKEFRIDIDDDAPEVIRYYEDRGNLKVETSEPATCYYDHRTCNFDIFEEGSLMTVGLSTTHSTTWENGKSYYIRCMDEWENYESGCSTIVKSWSF